MASATPDPAPIGSTSCSFSCSVCLEGGEPGAAPVRRVADVYLRGGSGSSRARVYSPARGRPPLLVFLQGGGIESADRLCRELCSQAEVVVLSASCGGRHLLGDATRVLGWAADHAAELGADPGRLLVAGAGAGGGLAASAALHARDHRWPVITRQVLIYPDLDALSEHEPRASPPSVATLAGVAPATVVTVEHDAVGDDGRRYAERLRRAGVRVDELRHDDRAGGVRSLFGSLRDRLGSCDDTD